jgi:uncharacterized membrane protein HdeD (DUF308 family)
VSVSGVRGVGSEDEATEPPWAWWVIALVGVLSVVAGIILVFKPSNSLTTLAVIFGIFLLIDGIGELIASFGRMVENRALAAILGVLGIVFGLLLIRHPSGAVTAIGLLIGVWMVAAGIVRLVRTLAIGTRPALGVLVALLEVIVGIVIVSKPHIGYATLAILIGIWLILSGLGTIGIGVALHNVTKS